MKYVALLRGINVGGNKKVPMADLKKILEKAGFENVKTLLASGNVIFESSEKKAENVRKIIETTIEKKFGFTVPTIIRTMEEIEKLITSDPFKGIKVTPETRLYVTFRGDDTRMLNVDRRMSTFRIPAFHILKVTKSEIISYLTVGENRGTVDAMGILEKEFGKNITTRNWNTVMKIAT